jgi:hypothetical protein
MTCNSYYNIFLSTDYDGGSCHLINDQCNDTSTCKHSGTCVTKEMGYTCDCKDGEW